MAVDRQQSLDYHSGKGNGGHPGKIALSLTKPLDTQNHLSMAYTPGVAEPCREIARDPSLSYEYTSRGNLVAVVSNSTAVLGLGKLEPVEAGMPVMSGKCALFKGYAGVDAFPFTISLYDKGAVVDWVAAGAPSWGGVNLEDIAAPDCFYIEETLKGMDLGIPIFHDDQHGTAIISGAALINALEINGKDIKDIKVVYSGAGAAGIACAQFYLDLGVQKENMVVADSTGVIYKGRQERMNPYKERFAAETNARTLDDVMKGADVFVGVSVKDLVTPDMLRSMASDPIVFAMANPDPEITYELARETRSDVIMATGRSDYPNQINNVLGFPFIFRGALDVRATQINEAMKVAAAESLARLAKEEVPQQVLDAYGIEELSFGPEYIVPKPFDKRVAVEESVAVAEAAIESGVAQIKIDLDQYRAELEKRFLGQKD